MNRHNRRNFDNNMGNQIFSNTFHDIYRGMENKSPTNDNQMTFKIDTNKSFSNNYVDPLSTTMNDEKKSWYTYYS